MSVWKKASKTNQKTHRERHQPSARQSLGLLEKKKDYKLRADDYNEKKQSLRLLHKKALDRNPDEFYHHMINSNVKDGIHFEKNREKPDTPDQIKLMRTQDLRYIISKRTQEKRKVEKLQSQLHICSIDHHVQKKHIFFDKDKGRNYRQQLNTIQGPSEELFNKCSTEITALYTELSKRIHRENELATIQEKMELERNLSCQTNKIRPKKLRKATKTKAAVYTWKYERKK